MSFKLSLEEVKRRTLDFGSEFLDDNYIGNTYKHKFKCANCGNSFYRGLNAVTNKKKPKNKCPECSPKRERLSEDKYNNIRKKSININKIEILTDYINYKNNSVKLNCKCLICNQLFQKNLSNIQSGQKHGCIFVSEGERITLDFFEKNGIQYRYQVTLPNSLISDFEIVLTDGILHLEIDGDQHYIYNKVYHETYDKFLKRQSDDKIKDDYYSSLNHKNLHIRYQINGVKNDNILNILNGIKNGVYGQVLFKKPNLNFDVYDISSRNNNSKKILCYNLNGEFIKEFNSILDASLELDVNRSTISDCLEDKYGRAKEYIFRIYKNDYELKIEPYKTNKGEKSVICYNLDGSFYKIFTSISEASRELNIKTRTISACVNNKSNKVFDYIIKEYNELSPLNIDPYISNKTSLLVYKDGILFNEYDSINEAHKDLKISRKKISKALKDNLIIFNYEFKIIS